MEHFELVRDANLVTWVDEAGENLVLDAQNAGVSQVFRTSRKEGSIEESQSGRYFNPYRDVPVLEVKKYRESSEGASSITAIWENRLPLTQKLQVELAYDVFCNADGKEPPVEVALCLYERNEKKEWNLTERFRRITESVKDSDTNFRIVDGERFRTYACIADLSKWAGEYVRLGFEMSFSKTDAGFYRMRWVQGRVISANFKIIVGIPPSTETSISEKDISNDINITPSGVFQQIPITDLVQYPDLGIPVVTFRGRAISYLHACFNGTNPWTPGTYAIDLLNWPYGWNGIPVNELVNRVVRLGASGPAPASPTYGNPFPVLSPIANPYYELDNFYSGIKSAYEAPAISGNTYLHAFYHAEDCYYNGQSTFGGNGEDRYIRIGYARSNSTGDWRDGYYFTRIISSGQPNAQIITAPFSESYVRGTLGLLYPNNAGIHSGAGSPDVIKYNGYYYMIFHASGVPYPYNQSMPEPWRSFDGICIARCPQSVLDQSITDYQNTANSWVKYYNGSWSEPGLGGTASCILLNRWSPKFSFNSELNKWVMTCDGAAGFYLHTATNLEGPWDAGILIVPKPVGASPFSYSALTDNSDKYTSKNNYLYYSSKQGGLTQHIMWRTAIQIED